MRLGKRLQVKIRRATRSLKDKNFKLFFYGQLISYTGVWITNVATAWLIYRLTESAAMLGFVTFTSQFPSFLISPFAGVHVDRMNKKKVIQICLSLSAFQSLLLGVLTLTNVITVSQLIVLGVFQAIVDGFYIPARQAFMVELVSDRSDLGNAIALNAASFHFARLIGPAIGGVLIALLSEGPCFIIDAVSYLAILSSLVLITPKALPTPRKLLSVWQDFSDGLQYIRFSGSVRRLLSFVAFVCLVGISHTVLLPVLVKSVYSSSAEHLGLLMGASGFGSLVAAIFLAAEHNGERLSRRMHYAALCFGVGIVLLSISPNAIISMPVLALCGFCFLTIAAGSNTIIQMTVSDQYRGRVMSFFAMCFTGMMPIGAIGSGWVADHIGVQQTLFIAGVLAACGGMIFVKSSSRSKGMVEG